MIVNKPQLDEEGLKEKKKTGFEAHACARREKLLRSAKKTKNEQRIRQGGSRGFVQSMPLSWSASRSATGARPALGDRKSTVAQARMKNIASLAPICVTC